MNPVVVFGGGRLGGAVARVSAAQGDPVVVASLTERAHAGLWRRWDARAPRPVPLRGARVCLALSPPPGDDGVALWGTLVPRLALGAWREGAAAVTVCGPAGQGEPGFDAFARGIGELSAAPRTTILRFGPLFGQDDGCVWPLLTALRQDGVVRLPRGLPAAWLLWIDDAARAVARTWDQGGQRVLRGPEALTLDQVGAAMTARFGGRQTRRWWPGDPHLARLRAWAELPDEWDEAALGARLPLARWIERLPGLRRRR